MIFTKTLLAVALGASTALAYVSTPCSMLTAVNKHRQAMGVLPLKLDRRLVASALAHTNDMLANQIMIHDSSNGQSWSSRVISYFPNWHVIAENVAEYSYNETQVMQLWIASPEHEANLVSSAVTHLGASYVNGYWTQDFAAPDSTDVQFLVDCTVEDGFAWTQPATAKQNFTGFIKTSEDLCLDASGPGNTVVANVCSVTSKTQTWYMYPKGAGFVASIKSTGTCLDVLNQSRKQGTAVGAVACTGLLNEVFFLSPKGTIQGMQSGMCLDLPGGATVHSAGTPLEQWPCNGGSNQIFTIAPIAAGVPQHFGYVGTLKTHEGLCLDGAAGTGKSISVTTCGAASAKQSWTLKQVGGAFMVQLTGTSLCLDVFGSSLNLNAVVGLYTCNDNLNQAWAFSSTNALVNLNSNKCIDLPGANVVHASGTVPTQ
ncbi:hypothetical protein HK101_001501 [Irineochytrium annulatum]|nr:hypothetical protein HK101_001501 [Irineochytrium annulatum]